MKTKIFAALITLACAVLFLTGNASAAFVTNESGISAYVNVGTSLNLDEAAGAYKSFEDITSTYLIGIVEVPIATDYELTHVYTSAEGWVMAGSAGAPMLTVDDSDGGDHTKIRDAINNVSTADTIFSSSLSIEEATDNIALNFTSGGDALWFGQDAVSYFGGDAAQSGSISHSQSTWVQTNVTNIGLLSFFWKVSSESGYDFLEFYIDGMLKDSISGEVNWTKKSYSMSAGNHTLKWSYRKDFSASAGNDAGWIDNIEFPPSVSIEEAVDNTALNFTSDGNALWFGQDTVSYFGGDAAQSGRISDSQSTWIQTNVTDIGMLSFFWKVSSEGNYDFLEFYIDGMLIDRISGEVNWTKKSYSIGSGNHSLKWMYKKDGSSSIGNDTGWIDKIEFSPSVSIEEAVDNFGLNFTSGGNASWFGQDAVSYFGGDAAQAGRISDSQSTWVQTNVTDIGMLSFFWKVSSEGNYDFLEFYIDGMLIDRASGEINWTKKSYSIGAGNHTLKWNYRKDGSNSVGNDTGWIDNIEFSPSLPLEEAVDNTALNFTSGGDALWFGQYAVSYFGGDAAQSGIRSNYQNTWIQTNVTDIGALSYFWKVSSASSHYLEFYIDGVQQERISGEVNWTKKSHSIDAGTHTLKWNYHKDSNSSAGNDTGWIDKIEHIWRLNISNVQTNKISYSLKENVTVSCIVRNETKRNISADNVTIKITKPDFSIEWFTMKEGLIGNYEGLFTNASLFGKYNVSIYANKTGYIDGIAQLSFDVLDEHDIAITKIDAPNSAFPNSVINVNATVRNSGLNDESNIIVDFIVDEVKNSNRTISFLASGSSSTISFQWTAPDEVGTHNMAVYARPVVNETINWNNRLNWSVSIRNLSLGTWTGVIDQGGNIINSLDFVVSQTGINYTIKGYHTQIQCYDHGAYWVSIFRNNIYVPIINNSFNYYGEFRGTFTSPVKASGNFVISEGSCGASGRWWASGSEIQDSSAPQNITNLTNITYAPTYINFTWTNPPDPDYHHVMLFLNGTFLTNITAPQNYYNITGLTPDTEYELGTHTVDSSGNVNETWVNATGRTAPLALESIQVTNPNANPAVILNDNGRARPPGTNITRLNVTVTGNVASVTIDLSPIGGSAKSPMTKISGTDIYTLTTNAISGINLTNNLAVNATGTSGNFNNSVSIPVTVLLRGDIVRDNKIDLKDLLYLRKYLAGLEPSINAFEADIQPAEGDGKVDLKDLLFLRRYIAGLEPVI